MNPKTGEILAMASRPTYDPNNYSKGNKEAYKNRAVVNVYEPGSTFKPLMAAAALDSGKWHIGDVYHDTGSVRVADRTIHNWDNKGMGDVTLREIIMYSINTGMAHVAVTTGGKTLTTYAQRFGFGTITGIELSGEQEGILFDPDKMSIVDTATMGIGQGIAVTPLQMVQAFSAIANEGHMMKPFLVKEIDNPDGSIYQKTEPKEVGQPINVGTAETISKFMGEEVAIGGGQSAKIEGYRFGGKTGTAQKKTEDSTGYAEGQYVGSFIGFGPLEDPQFLVLIVVDDPKGVYYGAQVAAPVFKEMMTEIVRMKGIRPTEEVNQKPLGPVSTTRAHTIPPVHISSDGVLMPSFIGWSTREVNDWLNEAGLGFVPKGIKPFSNRRRWAVMHRKAAISPLFLNGIHRTTGGTYLCNYSTAGKWPHFIANGWNAAWPIFRKNSISSRNWPSSSLEMMRRRLCMPDPCRRRLGLSA